MKKTGRSLSMILALAMAFALAVPAFAAETKSLTLEDVNFSVAPIGTATIAGEVATIGGERDLGDMFDAVDYSNVYVFDQDCVATMKDGRKFTRFEFVDVIYLTGEMGRDDLWESIELGDFAIWSFGFGIEGMPEPEWNTMYLGYTEVCYMTTKAYLDELTAAGATVTFTPLGQSPAQPEQPSKPTAPAKPAESEKPAAVKPAPGVSVPLNDGSGEFAYTVKSGDSLSRIAAYYYGDMNVYKLIFERNKDVLKNANTIYAGQTITLPSYAAVAAFKAAAK